MRIPVGVLLFFLTSLAGFVLLAVPSADAKAFLNPVVKVQPPKGKAGAEAKKGIRAWNAARTGYRFRVVNSRQRPDLILKPGACQVNGNARQLKLGKTVTAKVPRCKKHAKLATMRVIGRALGLPFVNRRCVLMSRRVTDCTSAKVTSADMKAARRIASQRDKAVRTAPKQPSLKVGYVNHTLTGSGWEDDDEFWEDDDFEDFDDPDWFASAMDDDFGDYDEDFDEEFEFSDDVYKVALRLRLTGAKNMFTWDEIQLRFQGVDDPDISWTEPVNLKNPLLTVPNMWTRNLRVVVEDVPAGVYQVAAAARNTETGRSTRSSKTRLNIR